MVRGLGLFRERFREFEKLYILIGGAACDEWFAAANLPFRATKDLDIVLIVEVVDRPFVARNTATTYSAWQERCREIQAQSFPKTSKRTCLSFLADLVMARGNGHPFCQP